MNKYYRLYGLNIETPIEFPEADELAFPDHVDATLSFEEPPDWVLQQYREGKYSSISSQTMWFRLNDELIIYVTNGNHAVIYPLNRDISSLRMRSYILTGAMTFLLMQRDYLLIHGSALVYKDKLFLVSGASGSGKSTTSLELLKNNDVYFASDDICAIKNENSASILYPGPPWQKLCPDVKEKNASGQYTYLDEAGGKYARKITERYHSEKGNVQAMFVLDCSNNELHCQEIAGVDKLNTLTHNIFRGELYNILGISPLKMLQFATTAASFPIYRITRPEGIDTTAQIVDYILEKMDNL